MILYPIGASSEAFLSLSTLPPLSTLSVEAITSSLNPLSLVLRYLPHSLRTSLIKTSIGKHALWSMARASVKRKGKDYWGFIEVARLVLFVIWWPGEFPRVRKDAPILEHGSQGWLSWRYSIGLLDESHVQAQGQGYAKRQGKDRWVKEDQLGRYQGRAALHTERSREEQGSWACGQLKEPCQG